MGKPLDPARLRRDSVKTVCEAAVRLWKTTAGEGARNVELACEEENEGPSILADSARLQQVFINLLDNAVQQSPPGAKVRVEIHKPEDGHVSIRVVDHGKGLDPETEAKLFQPFFTTRKGGTGLGLCIVQRVVTDHGGGMSIAKNHPPPGCTVDVRLPLAT
jgi:signal transduction histidine kinase